MSNLPPCIHTLGSESCSADPGAACNGRCQSAARLHCVLRLLEPGQHLFTHGDRQHYVYFIQSGLLRLYKTLGNGRRQVIGFSFAGEFVGLGATEDFRFNAQSIGVSEVRCLGRDNFYRLARDEAELSFRLYQAAAIQFAAAQDLALTVGQRDAEGSLAAFLLWMSRRNENRGLDPKLIALPMPRIDIADYLGLTGETVSRVFTRFKSRGFVRISRRRLVALTDIAALAALADGARAAQERCGRDLPAAG